jgi:hypothetical protein
MRWLLVLLTTLVSISLSAQPRVDDVGDGWKAKVDSAMNIIKVYDPQRYTTLINNCDQIHYWNGNFSTTEGFSIMISTREMRAGNLNNIAAILVHESLHLLFKKQNCQLDPNNEEVSCYAYELDFLSHIPNVEPWLIDHAKTQIKIYSKS